MKYALIMAIFTIGVSTAQIYEPVSALGNYQVTDFDSIEEAAVLWNGMVGNDNLKNDTNCYDRAHSWSYDLFTEHSVSSKKVIIHYNSRLKKDLDWKWIWHIAPAVEVNGETIVLDKGFNSRRSGRPLNELGTIQEVNGNHYINGPVPLLEWERYFTRSSRRSLTEKRDEIVAELNEERRELRRHENSLNDLQAERSRRLRQDKATLRVDNQISRTRNRISSVNEKINEYLAELASWGVPETGEVDFRCKYIDSIEQYDFDQDDALCFIQEISMYYQGLPQLRWFTYGTNSSVNLNRRDLPMARERGLEYEIDEFKIGQVWASKRRAFKDARNLFPAAYEEYDRAVNPRHYERAARREREELERQQREEREALERAERAERRARRETEREERRRQRRLRRMSRN